MYIKIFLFIFFIVYTAYTSTNIAPETSSKHTSSKCDPNVKYEANYSSSCCKPDTVFYIECNNCNCSKDGTYANCSANECSSPNEENCDPECYAADTIYDPSDDVISNNACYNAITNTTTPCCIPGSTYHNYLKDWNTCHCNANGTGAWCTDLPCPSRPEQTLGQKVI